MHLGVLKSALKCLNLLAMNPHMSVLITVWINLDESPQSISSFRAGHNECFFRDKTPAHFP